MEQRLSVLTASMTTQQRAADFTRWIQCAVEGELRGGGPRMYFEARFPRSPNLELVQKAAISAGTTTDAEWASSLAAPRALAEAFQELLRPATLIGRIPGLKRIPFNVRVPAQIGGGTYLWVGEGLSKPVTSLSFSTLTVGVYKVAGILVFTEELARSSAPDAEAVFRNDMIAGITAFLDAQFIDPAVADVAGVSPASITNGVTPITSVNNVGADVKALLATMPNLQQGSLLMSPQNASGAMVQMGVPGGTTTTLFGLNLITSSVLANNVVLVDAPSVLVALGDLTIDVSREAIVEMESTPQTATGALVSLWQQNYVGLRAEQFANWKRATSAAVGLVTGATYAATP
jgi:HK97 family phage major capsid protein